jgi:hypothetical protein
MLQPRTKKPLAIALSEVGRELMGRNGGSDLTKEQYNPVWNCHNEYILIFKKQTNQGCTQICGEGLKRLLCRQISQRSSQLEVAQSTKRELTRGSDQSPNSSSASGRFSD